MDYIRYQKSQPGYDPNTRHCLYGLDADLVGVEGINHHAKLISIASVVNLRAPLVIAWRFGRRGKEKISLQWFSI